MSFCQLTKILRKGNLYNILKCFRSMYLMLLYFFFSDFQRNCSKNKRHSKEIRTTYMAISIITSFAVLNFPRFIATIIEVVNTNLIIKCVENEVRYLPTISFYRLDYFARMLMVLNSAINFLIYCAVSTPFKVLILITVRAALLAAAYDISSHFYGLDFI